MKKLSLLPLLAALVLGLLPGDGQAHAPVGVTHVRDRLLPDSLHCPLSQLRERIFGEDDYESGSIHTGGSRNDDGTEVTCDLPTDQRKHNVGGRDGSGLCVFTSIMHAARWQSEHRLEKFQDQMRKEMGGGYPSKVDKMIERYGKGTQYVQYEGQDLEFLRAALRTGRMPSVTYNGHDPHYRGSIAHMVNLVHLDEKWAVVLDNNFVGDNDLVWMTPSEFKQRWLGSGGGWAVVLLEPPPPPVPHR